METTHVQNAKLEVGKVAQEIKLVIYVTLDISSQMKEPQVIVSHVVLVAMQQTVVSPVVIVVLQEHMKQTLHPQVVIVVQHTVLHLQDLIILMTVVSQFQKSQDLYYKVNTTCH